MNVMKLMYLFSILCVCSALTSCGSGGGGSTVTNAVPTGYYGNNGTAAVFADNNATPLNITDLQGMIHNNRFIMMSFGRSLSYDGTITVTGNSYAGSVTVYRNGVPITTATVDGMIDQGVTISGVLAGTGTGAGRGSFLLNYSAKNTEAADLNNVATIWPGQIGGSTSNFEFSVAPVTGIMTSSLSTTDGVFQACVLGSNSTIAPISGLHLFTVSLTLSGCAGGNTVNGTYTGLATTRNVSNDNMPFAVSNGAYSIHRDF